MDCQSEASLQVGHADASRLLGDSMLSEIQTAPVQVPERVPIDININDSLNWLGFENMRRPVLISQLFERLLKEARAKQGQSCHAEADNASDIGQHTAL